MAGPVGAGPHPISMIAARNIGGTANLGVDMATFLELERFSHEFD
jgi:hypothetical protein